VIERVFEPFFTTKEVGKGTGLGMSQIFGFVRQSGGDIAIRSAPGQGTTVSLYLPRGNKAAVAIPAMPASIQTSMPARPVETRLAGEPVLIVEDDPRVRAATTAAIAELGYRPIACGSGEDALVLLGEHGEINLMITDVVMPGMTGPELGAAVRTRHPGVRILYVTGYAGEAAEGGELEGEAVLRKPFTISALEKAVGDAVHRTRKAHAA
jgi:CheY-like chemotaxis protein